MEPVLVAVVGAIAGAFATTIGAYLISLLLDWLRDKKKGFHTIKKGLVGTWKSTSFDQKNEKWVEDEIDITLALGKICLKNLNPDLCGSVPIIVES